MVLYAIIRIRGTADVRPEVEATLRMLRLLRKNHAVIYPKTPSIDGMLKVIKDWVTWGEIDRETLKELIMKRGRLVGNKKITEEDIKRIFKVGSLDELVDALLANKIQWHKYDNYVKPVFRLNPPKGGFKGSIKRPFKDKGELGYRGDKINELLKRMI